MAWRRLKAICWTGPTLCQVVRQVSVMNPSPLINLSSHTSPRDLALIVKSSTSIIGMNHSGKTVVVAKHT